MLDLKRPRSTLLFWVVVHGVILLILGSQQDVGNVVLGRYSPGYAAFLGFVLGFGLLGVVTILLAGRMRLSSGAARFIMGMRSNTIVRAIVLLIGLAIVLYIWLTTFPVFALSIHKELLRGYVTLAVLITLYMLLFWRGRDQCVPWSAYAVLGITLSAVTLIIVVHYLDRFPQLNTIDELHNWIVQWTYANTGLLGDTLYKQMIPLPQPIYDSPHYIAGLMLRLIGDSFWQARFVRLLMALLALPFIYLSGVRMYGKRAALFAVVVGLLFIIPTDFVRPDVFVGLMLSIAIYVYLRAQTTRRPWMHYLTGLCVAVGMEGHPLAYRFGIAFALLYGLRWLNEMRQTRRIYLDGRVFALALGGFTGILIYLSIHIIPGWEQGLHFFKNTTPVSRTLAQQINLGQDSILLQFQIWIETSPVEFMLFVLGIFMAIRELKQGDRILLALFMVSEGLMIATYGYYREFYQVHYLPIVALLSGRFLANLTEARLNRSPNGRLSGFALAAIILIASLAGLYQDAYAAKDDPMRDEFTGIGRQLKATLPPNAIVMGNEDYFLEMRSLNYYGIQTTTTPNWFIANYQGYPLLEVTHPDMIILSGYDLDTPKYTPLYEIYRYIADYNFQLARCYTQTGLITANVYVRQMPPDWTADPECKRYPLPISTATRLLR